MFEMFEMIEVKDMNTEEAVALCKQEYMEELHKVKGMPPMDGSMEEMLTNIIHGVKGAPYGKAMISGNKLVGFLAFYGPWEGFHGVGKGVFSPLGASAFVGKERGKTVSLLLEAVAEELVQDKIFSIAISRYANNDEVNKSLCLNGFGIGCSDAVLSLQDYVFDEEDPAIVMEELLDTMAKRCMEDGKSYLGVDYETINPTAFRFWTKYFEPYTYSFMRRIDERVG